MDLIEIPRVDSIRFSKQSFNENQFVDGSICLTSHHLILIPKNSAEEQKEIKEIWVRFKIHLTLRQLIIVVISISIFLSSCIRRSIRWRPESATSPNTFSLLNAKIFSKSMSSSTLNQFVRAFLSPLMASLI